MKKIFALIAVAALVAFAAPAFAANPFADVPMNHWAYDAVAQLAASGIVVGYPDGAYKGGQPATRYELAAVVARALAKVDMEKASKQDLEMLKKLVVEFKSELDALGVKVDKLDARVAVLEERIGGWKFGGNFRFTAKWADDSNYWGVDDDTNWTVDRFRWNITKYVDDNVTLNVRLQGGGGKSLDVDRAYATIKFPWDITAQVGRFPLDWEGDFYAGDFAGYMMNDAYVTDYDPLTTAVWFEKPFSMGKFEMFVAHEEGGESFSPELNWGTIFNWVHGVDDPEVVWEYVPDNYIYGARLAFDFNENFHVAANYVKYDFANEWEAADVYFDFEDDLLVHEFYGGDIDFSTLWGDLIVNFNENIAFKGQYFVQDLNDGWLDEDYTDDSPSAWKAILQVSQDALKFTDLWIEYAQLDQGFVFANADPYAWALSGSLFLDGSRVSADTTVLNVVAKQKWNDQWWTYVRYADFDVDADDADYYNWTASVRYNYTPNLWFELGYDKLGGDAITKDGDDMVWFRTTVNF